MSSIKLVRITTVPISLKFLITGQMRFMREKGFEVTMMSADGNEIKEVVSKENCEHEVLPLTRKITPLTDLYAIWVLFKKLKHHNPDIVHTHTPKAGLIGMIASRLAGVPIRIHTVAGLPLQTTSGFKKILLSQIEKLTYLCSTEVWPNSKSLFKYILEKKLTTKKKLHIIGNGSSNGINISEFSDKNLDLKILEKVKNSFKYNPNRRYLLFVGRIVRDKGIEELVESFIKIKEKIKDIELVLVGPYETSLDPLNKRTIELIEKRKDIHSIGYSPNVKYYMLLASIFTFPSHREGFPNVVLQAGLLNLPVVASRITGNIDIIEHEKNGLLHIKGNSKSLHATLNFALNNPEILNTFAIRLKSLVLKSYNRKFVQREIFNKYISLIKK